MSKTQWGGGALFFLGLAANFLDVSGGTRWILCVLAIVGAIIWFVGFLGADDAEPGDNKSVNISGQGMSGNVVAAGRDAYQTIYNQIPPEEHKRMRELVEGLSRIKPPKSTILGLLAQE